MLDRTYRNGGGGESVHLGKQPQGNVFRFLNDRLFPGSAPDYSVRRRVRQVPRTGDIPPNVDVGGKRSKTTRGHVG